VIVDTSACIAVVYGEPTAPGLQTKLLRSTSKAMGAPSVFEAAMVATGHFGSDGGRVVREFLERFDVGVAPFGSIHQRAAIEAFVRFGKGRHPAKLNFGDCMSYAVAKVAGQPLLAVGDDFTQTDIELA
jgi:ribonuclease VapC